MNTLTEKDLRYYLGTGLKCLHEKEVYEFQALTIERKCRIQKWNRDADIEWINSFDLLPLMLPLSALTEHLPDGSVQIVELAKIMYPNYNEWRLSSSGSYAVIRNGYMTFEFDSGNNCFLINNCGIMDQLKCYEYLYANHFWLGDQSLFETGEIIDKRTLK